LAKRIVVAIDGPAGSGKSTLARNISSKLGFIYIDTGAMYRSVALWALRLGTSLSDHHRLAELARQARIEFSAGARDVLLNGEEVSAAIRTREVSEAASKVSAIPGVRRALVEKQREMAAAGSVVMEGRDIGTVVFPEADVKIFLDAHPEERAGRRSRELVSAGAAASERQIADDLRERDQRDRTRADSPLVQAPDAVYIDTTGMPIEEVEAAVLKIVRERTSNGQELAR
jgi:cytidylate kinase